ncbi:DUF2382 domain-containing protein [Fischerella thermalis]|uniref:DUF2382 domain-containing protein n=1 Tax=Fischerella thermalis TaxID=372787 RepID=UPI000C7FFD7D|nr:DUF2382 domain-containing protein [Fischerella thermalis]PLZ58197.1 photosystem reaction center subunit H [Fischerella thermalis WC344]PLZ67557.1 photosystem reaction center subunit H [Fischerella thermalis WC246]
MALYKLTDFDANYRDTFGGNDIKGMSVYAEGTNEKIGTVHDVLVDEEGHFRYLVVDMGFWIFGKKVLLPVGRSRIDHTSDRVYVMGITREQADNLPEYDERQTIDYDYEERVRGVYRTPSVPVDASAPLEASAPLSSQAGVDLPQSTTDYPDATPVYDRDNYTYDREPSLYGTNEQNHQTLRLYEERLIANKRRQKVGEVTVGKHVETEIARVAVPVEKERVVVERVTPNEAGRAVAPGEATFGQGEVTHMDIYEETPEIRKEAVVREEVRVRKEVDQDTVETQDTVRREELDVNTSNLPIEER